MAIVITTFFSRRNYESRVKILSFSRILHHKKETKFKKKMNEKQFAS